MWRSARPPFTFTGSARSLSLCQLGGAEELLSDRHVILVPVPCKSLAEVGTLGTRTLLGLDVVIT